MNIHKNKTCNGVSMMHVQFLMVIKFTIIIKLQEYWWYYIYYQQFSKSSYVFSSILVNIFQIIEHSRYFWWEVWKKKDFGNLLQSDNCPYVERFWKHFLNKHINLLLYLITTLLILWYSFFFLTRDKKNYYTFCLW